LMADSGSISNEMECSPRLAGDGRISIWSSICEGKIDCTRMKYLETNRITGREVFVGFIPHRLGRVDLLPLRAYFCIHRFVAAYWFARDRERDYHVPYL
jgi:hypothetical protein